MIDSNSRWRLALDNRIAVPDIVEVFVRAPAAVQDAAQTRGASLMFCRFVDLELLAPYPTRVRRGWGVRW